MATVDYFLKIDGIPGESRDASHRDEIDVVSWGWGETNHASFDGRGGASNVAVEEFSFTMKVNVASPKLFAACAFGTPIRNARLICRKAGVGQPEYLRITFTDVVISKYYAGGSPSDVVPLDRVSFNFGKIEVGYFPQKADGSVQSPVFETLDIKALRSI